MKAVFAGVFAFALVLPALEAQAFPLATVDHGDSLIQQVREGCGTGFKRGPHGGCIRQTAPRGPHGANECWFHNGRKVCR